MQGRTHLLIGIAVGAAAGESLGAPWWITAGSALGSLLPDIDLPSTTLGHLIYPLAKFLNKTFGHRGFLHSPLFLGLLSLVLYVCQVPLPFIVGNAIGFGSHLFLDMMNPKGVPLFFPYKKRFHIGEIPADVSGQYPVALCVCLVTLYFVVFG